LLLVNHVSKMLKETLTERWVVIRRVASSRD